MFVQNTVFSERITYAVNVMEKKTTVKTAEIRCLRFTQPRLHGLTVWLPLSCVFILVPFFRNNRNTFVDNFRTHRKVFKSIIFRGVYVILRVLT